MMAGIGSLRAQLTGDNPFSAADLANALIGSGVSTSAVTTSWFVLEATSEAGCLFADSVQITAVEPPSIIIPNAFTPNGDGLHHILSPVATRDLEDETHFRIYSRWGELVYQPFNVNSGWDYAVNGKPQEIGSYVYIFVGTNPRGEEYTLNGTITLLRQPDWMTQV